MKRILQVTLTSVLFILPMYSQSQPKGWRGIVPLHSTRADVIRLIGPANLDGDLYDLNDLTVDIQYSDGSCENGTTRWNVPPDTVISVSIAPNHELRLSDLRINTKEYKTVKDGENPEILYYTNDTEGITISVRKGEVRNIYYDPTSKDDYLRCPCASSDETGKRVRQSSNNP